MSRFIKTDKGNFHVRFGRRFGKPVYVMEKVSADNTFDTSIPSAERISSGPTLREALNRA